MWEKVFRRGDRKKICDGVIGCWTILQVNVGVYIVRCERVCRLAA